MKPFFFVLATAVHFSFDFLCFSQDTISVKNTRNGFFFELGGTVLYSINYERFLFIRNNFNLTASMGYSFLPAISGEPIIYSYPKHYLLTRINFIYSRKKIGLSLVLVISSCLHQNIILKKLLQAEEFT